MNRPRIIALWSVPRSRSTAFFRMMLERGDFECVHEPFSYLHEFGSVVVGDREVTNEKELMRQLLDLAEVRPVFFKDTTDERYDLLVDEEFVQAVTHSFLIRHPEETARSYRKVNPDVRMEQLGFDHLAEVRDAVLSVTNQDPPLIESEDLMRDPAGVVSEWCTRIGIDFLAEALHWSAGDRSEWAASSRWHRDVSGTTGFNSASASTRKHRDASPYPITTDDPLAIGQLEVYRRLHALRLGA